MLILPKHKPTFHLGNSKWNDLEEKVNLNTLTKLWKKN